MSGRFADCRLLENEENGHRCARRQCAQRRVATGCDVKRKICDAEGPAALRVAMPRY
jgi:hypothetical protein